MPRQLLVALAAAATLCSMATPADAGGFFGLSVAGDGFSLSVGASSWSPYGHSWHDPGWTVDFDATLSGYGEWVVVSGLGRVWRPWVAAGWRPFTHGRWAWTSAGWTWIAYEPWGWAPHHFGNWAYTTWGWVWRPGTTWHPGNVSWVHHRSYVGWYPCPPRGWSHAARGWHRGYHRGYDHGYGHGYDHGYADGWRDARYATWVDWKHLGHANDISRHSISHHQVTRSTSPGAVRSLAAPPDRSEVTRRTGVTVTETRLERRTVTVAGHRTEVSRPAGAARQVSRHAERTVRSALTPEAARTVEREVSRSRGVTAGRPSPGAVSPSTRSVRTAPSASHDRSPEARRPVAADRRTISEPEVGSRRSPVAEPRTSTRRDPPQAVAPSSRSRNPAAPSADRSRSPSRRPAVVSTPATRSAPSRVRAPSSRPADSAVRPAPRREAAPRSARSAGSAPGTRQRATESPRHRSPEPSVSSRSSRRAPRPEVTRPEPNRKRSQTPSSPRRPARR